MSTTVRKLNAAPLLRIGNPWLTGEGVERIAPLYVLNRFLEPNAEPSQLCFPVQELVKNPSRAAAAFGNRVALNGADAAWIRLAEGLFNPDKRVFTKRDALGITAHREGGVFPVVGGLVKKATDDGLGDNLRRMLNAADPDWAGGLQPLLFPSQDSMDSATLFVRELLGPSTGRWRNDQSSGDTDLLDGEKRMASFISNLIRPAVGAERLSAMRDLAHGIYLVAVLRMVIHPTESSRKSVRVIAYGGLPPGSPSERAIRAASESFQCWIRSSQRATAEMMDKRLSSVAVPSTTPAGEIVLDKVRQAMPDSVSKKDKDAILERIQGAKDGRELLNRVGFDTRELARRVRSLGANIGLVGPDRGVGDPRVFFDTPILGVLVRGLCGAEAMDFEDFIDKLGAYLGLVVGPGSEGELIDSVKDQVPGMDLYTVLMDNQEALRLRLLRTGLARSYSDSHTEVFAVV